LLLSDERPFFDAFCACEVCYAWNVKIMTCFHDLPREEFICTDVSLRCLSQVNAGAQDRAGHEVDHQAPGGTGKKECPAAWDAWRLVSSHFFHYIPLHEGYGCNSHFFRRRSSARRCPVLLRGRYLLAGEASRRYPDRKARVQHLYSHHNRDTDQYRDQSDTLSHQDVQVRA